MVFVCRKGGSNEIADTHSGRNDHNRKRLHRDVRMEPSAFGNAHSNEQQ